MKKLTMQDPSHKNNFKSKEKKRKKRRDRKKIIRNKK